MAITQTREPSVQEGYSDHESYLGYWKDYYCNLLEFYIGNRRTMSDINKTKMFDELKLVRALVRVLTPVELPSKINENGDKD